MDFFDHFPPLSIQTHVILRVAAEDLFMTISYCALHFRIGNSLLVHTFANKSSGHKNPETFLVVFK